MVNRISFSFIVIALLGCQQTKPLSGLSASESLATFEIADGFQVELVASEPLVADPVDMEIDEYGRLYVVEMHGYPLDKGGSGTVKLLSDTDGDGVMDKSTVFADKLILPTGVMRWKKGILVTDPPNVLYLEDIDGDGIADIREVVLTGFAVANPQHNVNNPMLGIDNWIYLGHEPAVTAKVYTEEFSDRGSEVYFPGKPEGPRLPENALGRSVRFQPDRFTLENLAAATQFGHTFDQWGRRFLVSNAHHIYQEVIGAGYLNRNPDLLVSNATESISDHGNAADVYPITKNPEHQLLTDLGVFTAACGITAYAGGLFPPPFDRVVFVAEPVGNLVHADILQERGATFTAGRMYEKKEFLAAADAWFRPVNMYTGPDGALYVVDYYRQIIEHPEWMADEVAQSGAVYNGIDQGRIYRITPKGTPPADWKLKLGDATTEELVGHLENPNLWWRQNAQRLLLDRNDKSIVQQLEKMAAGSAGPLGRLHALWTLQGLDILTAEILVGALKDSEAGVRENAIRIAEIKIREEAYKGRENVISALIALQSDPDAKVRFQALCTLGFVDSPQAVQARKQLLFGSLNDPWMQVAALSAVPSKEDNLLEEVMRRFNKDNPSYASWVERLSAMRGAGREQIGPLIVKAFQSPHAGWAVPVLSGLEQGLRNKEIDRDALQGEMKLLLREAFSNRNASLRKAAMNLLRVTGLPAGEATATATEQSKRIAADPKSDEEKRKEAIQFLSLENPAGHAALLKGLMGAAEPVSVQKAALNALNAIPDATISELLIAKWPSLTPGLREAAIGTFLRNEERIGLLLNAVEEGIIDPSVISWPRQVGLMAQGNEILRNQARRLLAGGGGSEQAVIKEYAEALTLTGDVTNGQVVFNQHCAICHQIAGKNGVFYGPDLATIRNRRPESVMADILDPNLSIADGYDIWNIELRSGETIQGLIASETPSAITIRNYGGVETLVARQEIAALTAMSTSVMTAGFDQLIDKQQMADLLAFLNTQ